jgi:predicted nucleic acid-binding protein
LTGKTCTGDRFFLDTNILIYLFSKDEPEKRAVSRKLVSDMNSEYVISTQVIGEFANILSRKFGYEVASIKLAIDDFERNFDIATIRLETISGALRVMGEYRFSFWDSMIVSSALENGCSRLYSEDLQHLQIIEERLVVSNPFF